MTFTTRTRSPRPASTSISENKDQSINRLSRKSTDATQAISRTEAVHEAMRLAIFEQRLKPGTKLPEDGIGVAFGTSRTIAREALGRLAVEGLVELRPNRGAFVANPSLEEGRQAFFVRRGLERLVTNSLAGNLKKSDVKLLREATTRERSAADRDPREALRLSGEFHVVLAHMTGNQTLTRYVSELVCRCSLVLAMYGRPHSAECGVAEHEIIVDALATGSATEANQLMDDHLAAVADRALLQERQPGEGLTDVLAPYAARVRD